MEIKMVTQIPLDYMHLILEGVVPQLINYWFLKSNEAKLSPSEIEKFDMMFLSFRPHFCREFQRKNRSIKDIKYWKATEYRSFLLYTGPVLLRHFLPEDHFNHFLLLHFGTRILCSKYYLSENIYAYNMFQCFVKEGSKLYDHFMTFNVHGLLHLSSNSAKFGPLDDFSAFKFESFLQVLKKQISKMNKPLEQVVLRLLEKKNQHIRERTMIYSELKYPCNSNSSYKTFISPSGSRYDADSFSNGVCMLRNNNFVKISHFEYGDSDIIFYGYQFLEKQFFFSDVFGDDKYYENLFPSFYFGNVSEKLEIFNASEIYKKCLCLNDDILHKFVITPLIN